MRRSYESGTLKVMVLSFRLTATVPEETRSVVSIEAILERGKSSDPALKNSHIGIALLK
jgi:hypothetical protein